MQEQTVKNWALEEVAGADIGDARLNKRLGHLLELLGAHPNKRYRQRVMAGLKRWRPIAFLIMSK